MIAVAGFFAPVFAGSFFLFEHLLCCVDPHVFGEILSGHQENSDGDTRRNNRPKERDKNGIRTMSRGDCSADSEKEDMADHPYRCLLRLRFLFGKNDDEEKAKNEKNGEATVLLKEHGLLLVGVFSLKNHNIIAIPIASVKSQFVVQ